MTTKQQLLQYAHLWKTLAWPGFWLKMAEPHTFLLKSRYLKLVWLPIQGRKWIELGWSGWKVRSPGRWRTWIQCFWSVDIESGESGLFLSNWQVQSGCLVNAHPGAHFFSPSLQVRVSKDGPQTCSRHSTWGLARNANSQLAPRNYWICSSEGGAQQADTFQVTLRHTSLRTPDLGEETVVIYHSLQSRQWDNKQLVTKCKTVFLAAREIRAKGQIFLWRVETKNNMWEVCQDSQGRKAQSSFYAKVPL